MGNPFRDFFRAHPQIIKATEALEHLGFDAAEELVLKLVGQKLGVFSHLFPLETIATAAKNAAETAVDGALDSFIAPEDTPPAEQPAGTQATAAPASVPAPVSSDPRMAAKQAVAAAREAEQHRVDQDPNAGNY